MPTVTKNDLIDRIAKQTKRPRTEVRTIVQAFLNGVVEEVGRDSRLEFRDFGVFQVLVRKARMGKNPKTGEPVPIPRRRSVKFKPGRLMREALAHPPETVVQTDDIPECQVVARINPNNNGAPGARVIQARG